MSRWEDGELWYTPEEWRAREQIRARRRQQIFAEFIAACQSEIRTSADPPGVDQELLRQPRYPEPPPKLWK